jgi:hypothetical protein
VYSDIGGGIDGLAAGSNPGIKPRDIRYRPREVLSFGSLCFGGVTFIIIGNLSDIANQILIFYRTF